jgi:ribonuclease H / adenosylcobalamin/alpha-ribazole phosphatase
VIVVYLVRHGANDTLGQTIAGRAPGVSLNEEGRRQAERLAEHFAGADVTAIHSSPLERARETAEPIARRLGLPVEIAPGLDEIDCGEWTGASLQELDRRADWRRWNSLRGSGRAPGGESMLEVQTRMVGHIERLAAGRDDGRYVLVGHGDPIKSAIFLYLGLPIDFVHRVEISPASVSALAVGEHGPCVLFVNRTPAAEGGPE